MPATSSFVAAAVGLVLLGQAAPALAIDGLSAPASAAAWPRWQLRLALPELAAPRLGLGLGLSASNAGAPMKAALLGDYDLGDFSLALPGTNGRFRATSGLMFTPRGSVGSSSAWTANMRADAAPTSAPYLGVGYSGWFTGSGLSFTADLGLTADLPGGSWRLGRALFGNQGADAAFRELRLQPRLQLGVQYTY